MLNQQRLQELVPDIQWQLDKLKISASGAQHGVASFDVNDGTHHLRVKQVPYLQFDALEAEADGLQALAVTSFRIPAVVACESVGEQGYLAMEHLDLRRLSRREDAEAFAEALGAMHEVTDDLYGYHRDNYLGATHQVNSQSASWCEFFIHSRFEPQLELLTRNLPGSRVLILKQKLLRAVEQLLGDHQPKASLLHGDLWSGNAACCADEPAIYDPAVYYGDADAELAMMLLFGGFTDVLFYYDADWNRNAERLLRIELYQLYHLLNHMNLFGQNYESQSLEKINHLIRAMNA